MCRAPNDCNRPSPRREDTQVRIATERKPDNATSMRFVPGDVAEHR
jgi:hypothetical protein